MTRNRAVPLVLVSILALGACDRPEEPFAPSAPETEALARPLMIGASDQESMARSVPGFGGLFYDQRGTPTIYLTDLDDAFAARRALANVARQSGVMPNEIVVLQGAHRYGDLKRWYDASWADVLDMPGAVFSDLDEAGNRLLFGVENAAAATGVRMALLHRGVPADMFEIVETEPIEQAATLRDRVRPTQGGLQIHFSQFLCTLGFNASFGGTASFITNSHCTKKQGGVERTDYYQPTSTVDPSVIATEVADPSYFRGGVCPKGKKCRYSDSSRANYASGVSSALGSLAATGNGSITITGTHTITSEADGSTTPVSVGQAVRKVGRTTGTSAGNVSNTCVHTNVSGTNITQLCQTFVNAAVGGGDSGSPVFTGTGNVTLVGILWGGNSSGTMFVFSPLSSIKAELGSFTAH